MLFDDFGDAKIMFFIGTGDKICILAKNELWQSLDGFLTHVGCILGARGGKVGSRRGSKKTSMFATPFFQFWLIWSVQGGRNPWLRLTLLGSFSAPWSYFFDRVAFLSILIDVQGFGAMFL